MRSQFFAVLCTLVLCALVVGGVSGRARAATVPHVLSETNGSITLDFIDDGAPEDVAVGRFYVAISNQGSYNVSVNAARVERVIDPPAFIGGESIDSLRARSTAADTFRVYSPFLYRGTRVIYVEFQLFLFPAGTNEVYRTVGTTVTITYQPAPATNNAQTADPMLADLVVNENLFPSEVRGSSSDPWFSRASNWVKIPVSERGVYAVTGADLQNLGIAVPGQIGNPATFRLFSQFGLDQARDFSDPNGSWMDGNAMREASILVEDGGDGTFDLGDRIVFYGVGSEGWADYYDSTAPDTVYHRHTRARTNYYFLAWDSSLPGSPRRITQTSGAPGPGPFVSTYVQRDYFEKDRLQDFDFRGDGWLWLDVPEVANIKRLSLETESVTNLDATQPQTFRTVGLSTFRSPRVGDPPNLNSHLATYVIRRSGVDVPVGQASWTATSNTRHYEDGTPVRASGFFLQNGANAFLLDVEQSPNPKDAMSFAWFSVFYHRFLAALPGENALGFSSPDTVGTASFSLSGFDASTTAYVFDVTEMDAPVRLSGVTAGTTVQFGDNFTGERRHYWVAKPAGLKHPSGMLRYTPNDLRKDAVGADMLIITHDLFQAAAIRLRDHRQRHMPYVSNPRVKIATTKDIFDNFSGGMPDAMAVRNYIKFMYDHYNDSGSNPTLRYVLLLGDATEDFRNNVSGLTDYVPSNLYFTVRTSYAFVTDEWFGHLDPGDQVGGQGYLDVALGRLPVASTTEARIAADKIIAYETDPDFGPWRHRIVLAADDELSSSEFACDVQFTTESEFITHNLAANFLDVHKIYLAEYPRFSGIKPASRLAFLSEWNDGALIINYIGHGSSQQMADEQVFLGTDVALLNNGSRLPLLCALSCTIGDFANFQSKSLSEKLLLREGGGVIGTVCASRETFANQNERLNFAIFLDATPRTLGRPARPIGEVLMRAKTRALLASLNQFSQEENDWKYNLMTDPALRLRVPEREVRMDMAPADTMTAGVRKTIGGAVYNGNTVDTSFNGSVSVTVREPEIERKFLNECSPQQYMQYRVPGGVLYQGSADVSAGRFSVSFRVPRSARTGPRAFITAYADNGVVDAAVTLDSVLTLVSPTEADSLELQAVDGAPRVVLGFKSGLKTVKPGETLQAIVHDGDGIDILDTTNEGKQALLFDGLPVPIDANDYFEYDHGGTDTSGVLLYPLPELSFGNHRAIYKVSDAFGQTTLDTLQFSVTDPQDFFAEVLLNYPNPFKTETQFLVRISDRASIHLDIFTVSGRRIRRINETHDGGEVWIPWDGRDSHGAQIANGTYLYVARIDFVDIDREPLVLRGKLSKIE